MPGPGKRNDEREAGPGFLDVEALAARRAGPNGGAPSPPAPAQAADGGAADQAAPAADPAPSPARGGATPPRTLSRAAGWTKLAVAVIVLLLLACGGLLLLPGIVRSQVIARAREAQIDLSIEEVGLGFDGVSLRGVAATSPRLPGSSLRAEEVFAAGLSAREVQVRGATIALAGRADEVGAAVVSLFDDNRARLAGTAEAPRRVSLVSGTASWSGPFGEGSVLTTGPLAFELESAGVGAEKVRASVSRFEVKTSRTVFGPWAASLERSGADARLRVLFDPAVPDGPSALAIAREGAPGQISVRVPRSPLRNLGVRPADLGLPADGASELEAELQGGETLDGRLQGSGTVVLHGAHLRGLAEPVDVTLALALDGAPGEPLTLQHTTVKVGPFLANVTGTVTPYERGLRLDAAWRTEPIPCSELARAEAERIGPVASAIQQIAHATRAVRVTGTAHAAGLVRYDTAQPDQGTYTLTTKQACGLSIFGL